MNLSFDEREAMDATGYSIAGYPVVGLFIVLLAVICSATLAVYASTWSQEYSKELTGKGVFELAAALAVIGISTSAVLLLTYNFLWTAVALIISGIVVVPPLYLLEKRESLNSNS